MKLEPVAFDLSHISRTRLKRNAVLSALIALAGGWLWLSTGSILVATVAIYGVLATGYRLHVLRHARPHVEIDDDGLTLRWWRTERIDWSDIETIQDWGRHGVLITATDHSGGRTRHLLIWWRVETPEAELRRMIDAGRAL
jgi:hypothetical protein